MVTASVVLSVAVCCFLLGLKIGARWQRAAYAKHLPTWHKRPREADRMAPPDPDSPMVISSIWHPRNLPSSTSRMER